MLGVFRVFDPVARGRRAQLGDLVGIARMVGPQPG
jgi:hypothetical protein